MAFKRPCLGLTGYLAGVSILLAATGARPPVSLSLWEHAAASIDAWRPENAESARCLFNFGGRPARTHYTTADPAAMGLSRNPSCWASNLRGRSAVAVGMSEDATGPYLGSLRWNPNGYTLIAPDVIIYSAHTGGLADGTGLWFMTEDGKNTVVTGYTRGEAQAIAKTDFIVQRISTSRTRYAGLPAGIHPMKLPPATFAAPPAAAGAVQGPPLVMFDQFNQVSVANWAGLTANRAGPYAGNRSLLASEPSVKSSRHAGFVSKILGDSGHPMTLVVNSEFVLLSLLTFGGAGSGVATTWDNLGAINEAIALTGSASTVGRPDATVPCCDLGAFGF